MRRLGYFGAVLAMVWSGWWWVGSIATETALTAWLEDRRAAGWAVDYGLATTGYPTAFDTTVDDLRIADPASGLAWNAPRLEIRSAAWAPNAIDVVFPPSQVWASPYGTVTITARRFEAGGAISPVPRFALTNSTLAIEGMRLAASDGRKIDVESLAWTSTPGEGANSHVLDGTAIGITLPQVARRQFDPRGLLPGIISELRLEGTFGFDAPWDLDALERRRPQPTRVELRNVHAVWGGLELRVVGTLDVDAQGIPEGRLDVKAVNWRDMVELMQSNGTLPAEIGPFAMAALEALAGANGRPDTLDAPLNLSGGFIRFGPVPIGPAPRLVIR